MGVISVRLDNDTEARLKREARAQGVSFSDFLRKRLTGEQQEPVETAREKPVETARGESAETVLSALRQIADFLCRMEQEQRESGYFTQRLVFNSLRVLAPSATEGRNKMWAYSLNETKKHMAGQEGESS